MPSNFASSLEANTIATSSLAGARLCTVNACEPWIAGNVWDCLSTHTTTSGGLAETEQNALTVNPRGSRSASTAVTTTTPAGNRESASLNGSNVMACS